MNYYKTVQLVNSHIDQEMANVLKEGKQLNTKVMLWELTKKYAIGDKPIIKRIELNLELYKGSLELRGDLVVKIE